MSRPFSVATITDLKSAANARPTGGEVGASRRTRTSGHGLADAPYFDTLHVRLAPLVEEGPLFGNLRHQACISTCFLAALLKA